MEQLLVKQLGALPVIRTYLERLCVRERIDALAPVRELAHLTNGQVVEALVANRLTAPRPLYDIVNWAEAWAVEATLGLSPAALNDDRLGRCLDDLAAVHDQVRGDLTVQAVAAFGLDTRTLRWDLTSVVVTGAYPAEEQVAGYAQVGYGYGGGQQQQVRYLQVTTTDGAVPIWDQVHDGNTTDVATVIATMRSLQEQAQCHDFVLVGDSKLLSVANRQALLAAGLGYLAPLARTPALDAAWLAIPAADLELLDYVSVREQGKPLAERTTYWAAERRAELKRDDGPGGPRPVPPRRLFVLSSEEQAACRRSRARQRERAEVEIARVIRQVGGRWYPTAERAQGKITAILERRHLTELYQVTCVAPTDPERAGATCSGASAPANRPRVTCAVDPVALARAETLDGYYVLETTRTVDEADSSALLSEWKGQWQIEHRHRNAKGPLRIRPLFVTSNQRIVGLITILGIALLVFSLIEREARRALEADAKIPNLLAGHVAARPTGENLLKALREIALVTLDLAGHRYRRVSELTRLQRTILPILGVPEGVYADLEL